MSLKKVRMGQIHADHITFDAAIDAIVDRAKSGEGGYVVTPNVDHVVLADSDPALREAYEHAFLSLVDGMPLLWFSKLAGHPLPEKISGSDLAEPLVMRAAKEGLPVYFLGAKEGVGVRAAERLNEKAPRLKIAGVHSPPLGFEKDPAEVDRILTEVRESGARILLLALGCPKQELFMAQNRNCLSPAVALGIGATLDFLAGDVKRAPAWVSRIGLEWGYRLAMEPRRLAHRYLVRDRAIGRILAKTLRLPRNERAFYA